MKDGVLTVMIWVGVAMLLASLAASLFGCATTCAVIDTAQQVCVVVRYIDEVGAVREVRLSPAEARDLARTAAARHDAGTP